MTLTRSRFSLLLLLAFCCLWLNLAQAEARKNILLIIADDQGLDTHAYGNQIVRTPNLDRLAARGTRFLNGFATVSSCSPSRSVILSALSGMDSINIF